MVVVVVMVLLVGGVILVLVLVLVLVLALVVVGVRDGVGVFDAGWVGSLVAGRGKEVDDKGSRGKEDKAKETEGDGKGEV